MRIILASSSQRRREILARLGYKFDAISPATEERTNKKRPSAIVKDLALQKAFAVAALYPDAVVIGGDTLVYCKGQILGKPKNRADALRLLRLENGSWQRVYSGLAIIQKSKNKIICGCDITACKARHLSEAVLQRICGKHMDKAGAYAMQDEDDMFIERIKGSRDNVVGMPSELFLEMIREFK
jgi:septum formation protein